MKSVVIFTVLIQLTCGDWIRISGNDVGNQPSDVSENSTYPGSRAFQAVWADDEGNAWVFGGYGFSVATDQPHTLNDLWFFNSTGDAWVLMHPGTTASRAGESDGQGINERISRIVPKPRSGASACGVPGLVFIVFGGEDSDGLPLYDTWLYDIEQSNVWIPLHIQKAHNVSHPPARSHASRWCLADRMLIFGGTGENGKLLSDVWQFSFKDLQWELMCCQSNQPDANSAPEPRSGATTWVTAKQLYMYGGSRSRLTTALSRLDADDLLDDLWVLDEITFTWIFLNVSSQSVRMKPGVLLYGNAWVEDSDLFLLGGYGHSGPEPSTGELSFLNDLWMYDTLALRWYRVPLKNTGQFSPRGGNTDVRYEVPSRRCCGTAWASGRVFYLFDGLGEDARGRAAFLNDLYIASNNTSDLTPYLRLAETHSQKMIRELSPKMIFVICLSSVSSVCFIFFAILFLKKMIEYHPRHTPPLSTSRAKYAPVEILDIDPGSDLEIEM